MPSRGSVSSARCRTDDRRRAKASGSKTRYGKRRDGWLAWSSNSLKQGNQQRFNANSCSNSSFLHPLPCSAPNREFFARNREYLAPDSEFTVCSLQCVRIAIRLHGQDGVAILSGRRSFAKSRPSGGDLGLCSGGSLASRTRTTKGAKCYNPLVGRKACISRSCILQRI